MTVRCLFCAKANLPSFLGEVEPYSGLRVVDVLCSPLHVEEVQARLVALAAAIRAEGEGS